MEEGQRQGFQKYFGFVEYLKSTYAKETIADPLLPLSITHLPLFHQDPNVQNACLLYLTNYSIKYKLSNQQKSMIIQKIAFYLNANYNAIRRGIYLVQKIMGVQNKQQMQKLSTQAMDQEDIQQDKTQSITDNQKWISQQNLQFKQVNPANLQYIDTKLSNNLYDCPSQTQKTYLLLHFLFHPHPHYLPTFFRYFYGSIQAQNTLNVELFCRALNNGNWPLIRQVVATQGLVLYKASPINQNIKVKLLSLFTKNSHILLPLFPQLLQNLFTTQNPLHFQSILKYLILYMQNTKFYQLFYQKRIQICMRVLQGLECQNQNQWELGIHQIEGDIDNQRGQIVRFVRSLCRLLDGLQYQLVHIMLLYLESITGQPFTFQQQTLSNYQAYSHYKFLAKGRQSLQAVLYLFASLQKDSSMDIIKAYFSFKQQFIKNQLMPIQQIRFYLFLSFHPTNILNIFFPLPQNKYPVNLMMQDCLQYIIQHSKKLKIKGLLGEVANKVEVSGYPGQRVFDLLLRYMKVETQVQSIPNYLSLLPQDPSILSPYLSIPLSSLMLKPLETIFKLFPKNHVVQNLKRKVFENKEFWQHIQSNGDLYYLGQVKIWAKGYWKIRGNVSQQRCIQVLQQIDQVQTIHLIAIIGDVILKNKSLDFIYYLHMYCENPPFNSLQFRSRLINLKWYLLAANIEQYLEKMQSNGFIQNLIKQIQICNLVQVIDRKQLVISICRILLQGKLYNYSSYLIDLVQKILLLPIQQRQKYFVEIVKDKIQSYVTLDPEESIYAHIDQYEEYRKVIKVYGNGLSILNNIIRIGDKVRKKHKIKKYLDNK